MHVGITKRSLTSSGLKIGVYALPSIDHFEVFDLALGDIDIQARRRVICVKITLRSVCIRYVYVRLRVHRVCVMRLAFMVYACLVNRLYVCH